MEECFRWRIHGVEDAVVVLLPGEAGSGGGAEGEGVSEERCSGVFPDRVVLFGGGPLGIEVEGGGGSRWESWAEDLGWAVHVHSVG